MNRNEKKTPYELALMLVSANGGGTAALAKCREAIDGCTEVIETNPPQAERAKAVRDLMHEVECELIDLCSGV